MMLVARDRKARRKTNLRKKGGKRELQKITIESKITTKVVVKRMIVIARIMKMHEEIEAMLIMITIIVIIIKVIIKVLAISATIMVIMVIIIIIIIIMTIMSILACN